MSWKKVALPEGAKLFQVHHFTYMHGGTTYHFEVDEFQDGVFTGHGEHSTDRNRVLASVTGKSLDACLTSLIKSAAK